MSRNTYPPPSRTLRADACAAKRAIVTVLTTWESRLTPKQRQILATAESLAEMLATPPDPTLRCRCPDIPRPHYIGDHE